MMDRIEIVELLDDSSWEIVQSIIIKAHSDNISQGLVISSVLLSTEQLKRQLGQGKCFMAKKGDSVVGVAAVSIRNSNEWFSKDKIAHFMYDAILPDYRGQGIYRMLQEKRFEFVRQNSLSVVSTSTAANNKRMVKLLPKQGFKRAVFFRAPNLDHFSVKWVKWLDGRPSFLHCQAHYLYSVIKTRTRFFLNHLVK